MEYIKCTHCDKRYAVNDKIRRLEGDFVRCKACHEKFLMVVHDAEQEENGPQDAGFVGTDSWNPELTSPPSTEEDEAGGWDPSLTMPTSADSEVADSEPSLDDEEAEKKAQLTLAAIQKEKSRRIITYAALIATLILLGISWYIVFGEKELEEEHNKVFPTVAEIKKTVADIDKANPLCRQAAARQWLIDYRAMHQKYTGEEFVQLLKDSKVESDAVREHCKRKRLLKIIITAATAKEKPEWFKAEIEKIQADNH